MSTSQRRRNPKQLVVFDLCQHVCDLVVPCLQQLTLDVADETKAMADEIDIMDSLALEHDDDSAALNSEDFFSANSEFSDGSS